VRDHLPGSFDRVLPKIAAGHLEGLPAVVWAGLGPTSRTPTAGSNWTRFGDSSGAYEGVEPLGIGSSGLSPFTYAWSSSRTCDGSPSRSSAPPPVETSVGTTRLLLDKPFIGRLPLVHRLDVSLARAFDVSFGQIILQAGVVNAYDRQNMFYYDLFTGRRLDQQPLVPYVSLTVPSR